MKHPKITIFSSILLILMVALTFFQPEKIWNNRIIPISSIDSVKIKKQDLNYSLIEDTDNAGFKKEVRQIKENSINLLDMKIDFLDKKINSDSLLVLYSDKQKLLLTELKSKDDKYEALVIKVLKNKKDYSKEIVNQKNSNYHEIKRNMLSKFTKSPNIWALLLIIFFSGLIGGLARAKYFLLDDIMIEMKNMQSSAVQSLAFRDIDGAKKSFNTINSKIDSLMSEIEEIKGEENEKVFVNILYGIIASSLAFLILFAFTSKVLDFVFVTDYFIFLGWCMLSAVYSKSIIKALYGKLIR